MFVICTGNYFAGMEILIFFSASHTSLMLALLLWHLVTPDNGLRRFCSIAGTLHAVLALRTRLNLCHWVKWLSQRTARTNCQTPLPTLLSPHFLLRRDGHTIFDFFKTLSISDVSPPVPA